MSGEYAHLNPPKGDGEKSRDAILRCIAAHVKEHGWPPTVREICEATGLDSTSTVHAHLWRLVKDGRIVRDEKKPRALRIIETPDDAA